MKGETLTSRNELKKSRTSAKSSKRYTGNSNAVSDFKKLKTHPSTAVQLQVGVDNRNETEVLYDTRFIDVSKLPKDGRINLQTCLLQADSLSFTIIYNDGSTLITTGHQQQENNKKKLTKNSGKSIDKWAKCICGAIRGGPFKEYKDQLLVFPLEDESEEKEYFSWFREMMLKIFKEREVIIFDAQRIIITLIEVFHLQDVHKKETENWDIQDPLLGVWLLDANKSPKTFLEVLRFAKLTPINHRVVGKETSWYIKANLLLMMAAVKKINALLKEQNIYNLYICVETKLIPILACMETARFKIEMSTVAKFSDILKKKLLKLETQAFHATGHSFSINSHPQLRQVLYEELQLDKKLPSNCKMVKTSVAHQKSTSESMLSQMAAYHPLPNIILEYRQLQKLKSTYVDGMVSCIEKGYLSTHWDQIAAATGRLSSYHPNIQAIPKTSVTLTNYMDNFIEGKHDESKMDIYAREPFISHDGWVLLAADFQQVELRLLAHLSKDEQLLSIFDDDNCKDIFRTLTSQWLCKAYDKISQVEREQTKRIVYSVMYGVGKDRLADYLKVSPDNAKAIMNSFLIKFPAVNRFTKTCVEFCKKNGFTSTIFGRRRYVPNIRSFNPVLRAQAERQCVNFCVQGSAADLCKSAMIKVEFALQNFNSRLLVQIHDELVWEVPESQIAEVTEIVKRIMEDGQELCQDIATLSVPIAVTVSTGRSWAHLKTTLFTPELECRNS
ncbi:DNA polymerase nu isoform X2 [Patella vulgata]|nr:DNA polymerase nu isoform X2 [Patella vulgata]